MNTSDIKYLQKIAWTYAYTGFPIDELIQVGAEAWLRANMKDTETDPHLRRARAAQDAKWGMLRYMKQEILHKKRELPGDIDLYPDSNPSIVSELLKIEAEQRFWTRASRLKPSQRQILRLMREGYTYNEIAEEMGWSHSNIRSEVYKSLKFINKSLDILN